jgi:drug/metabolite transporter (DMT)-like permease
VKASKPTETGGGDAQNARISGRILPSFCVSIGRPEATLIFVTILWGGTFLVVQNALSASGAFFFVGVRFSAAAAMLALLSWRQLGGFTLAEVRAGAAVGVAMVLGYTLQTIGLETILSSKSAFLTALYVPIVPLLQWIVLRKAPHLAAWTGIGLAFAGLVLLTGPAGASFDFSKGDIVTVLCAVAFAGEIILIGTFAGSVNARRVTIAQLGVAAALAFGAMPLVGEAVPPFSWLLALTALGMGLASAIIQYAMNWAQRSVSPTRATIIYAGEPVWAGLFGRLAGEVLTPRAIAGAGLIVLAVLISELRFRTGIGRAADIAPDAERP